MKEVCRDNQPETKVMQISHHKFERIDNTAEAGYFCYGLCSICEKTNVGIRNAHPTSQSYSEMSLSQIY